MRKFLKSSKVCLAFPGKWFCIRQPNSAFSSLESIFHGPGDSIYDFCQTSKQIYGKRQYTEKGFGGFEALLHFSRKKVLYSWT